MCVWSYISGPVFFPIFLFLFLVFKHTCAEQLAGVSSLHHVGPGYEIQVKYTFKHSIIFKS